MPSDELLELCRSMGMPLEDTSNAFIELKSRGFVYTPARTAREFATRKYPVRMLGQPPPGLKQRSEVSMGPFPVKRDIYERARDALSTGDAFRVLLGFFRLAYEKTGGMVQGYEFASENDPLYSYLGLMEMWDIYKPEIFEDCVWIVPNERAKKFVEKLTGKKFPVRDFTWWNIRLDLGSKFEPTVLDDYPEQFSIIPTELTGPWARYLPIKAWVGVHYLYSEMARGGILKPFSDLNQVLSKIRDGLEHSEESRGASASFFDRELLIKELCEYNDLTYPTDDVTTLEFFQQLGFIHVAQFSRLVQYSLARDVLPPKKALKIPRKWEERMDTFLKNGSVLFSYLKLPEIVDNN